MSFIKKNYRTDLQYRFRRSFRVGVTSCILTGLLLAFGNVWGQEPQQQQANVFTLSASASGEAANDLMRATLVVQGESEDASELQSRVNATTQWALARLRPFTGIKVKTQDYQAYPNYDRTHKNIIGWQASQSLLLESDDIKAAAVAIAKLQERLTVAGIRFEPKPDTRQTAEDQLINDALNAFKQRAQLITPNMGASEYTLLDINVQTGFQGGRPSPRIQDLSRSSSVTEPGLEGGASNITVQVHGRMQLGVPR